ncbi:MAG: hypothetical protein DMG06_14825 [Acidobacteria bacterium]|nr:MAG: hypothetical protein DMG06_14825 [Acidobacteriota bacterium]
MIDVKYYFLRPKKVIVADQMEVCSRPDETQDGSPVACGCLSGMVALEISAQGRTPCDWPGNASVNPTLES